MIKYSVEIIKVGSDERFCWLGGLGEKSEDIVKMSLEEMVKCVEEWGIDEGWISGMEIRVCRLLGE